MQLRKLARSGRSPRGDAWFHAMQQAHVVRNAEEYYRAMFARTERVVEPARHAHGRHDRLARRITSAATARPRSSWCGRTTRTSAMRARPRWATTARSRSVRSLRQRHPNETALVGFTTHRGHVIAATTGRSRRNASACGRRCPAAGRSCSTRPAAALLRDGGAAATRASASTSSGCSARSASCTGPRPSDAATTPRAARRRVRRHDPRRRDARASSRSIDSRRRRLQTAREPERPRNLSDGSLTDVMRRHEKPSQRTSGRSHAAPADGGRRGAHGEPGMRARRRAVSSSSLGRGEVGRGEWSAHWPRFVSDATARFNYAVRACNQRRRGASAGPVTRRT